MKRRNIAIMAMLAITAGQAFAQRCLPQMKGIEVKVGMADGVYNGTKSCKAGYYAGLGLSSYTKGGDKWTYGAEYLQVHQPYRETSVPIAQMTGEFGYSTTSFPTTARRCCSISEVRHWLAMSP